MKKQLYWLKREDCNIIENIDESEIPHEFLCPITHEIMKEPVQCSGKNVVMNRLLFEILIISLIKLLIKSLIKSLIISRWIHL